jgi:hypothetical protein
LIGALAVGLFGAAHALVIVPIWSRLGFGIPFAVIAGAALGWAHYELVRCGRLSLRSRDGMVFGSGAWLLFLPPTLIGVVARLTGWHARAEHLEVAAELVAAGLSGFGLGWWLGKGRTALSGLVVALAFTAAVGGPLPLTTGGRAFRIWFAFLLILSLAGLLHTILVRQFRESSRGG